MTKKFNLSKKAIIPEKEWKVKNYYWEEDVKEFIRLLKDNFAIWCAGREEDVYTFERMVDALAGGKLT